jgi:hypothetical protein
MQAMLAGRAYQSGTFMLCPRERSFSSKISDQLDRDCEPANNFGALWKVRSWRPLAGVGWRPPASGVGGGRADINLERQNVCF